MLSSMNKARFLSVFVVLAMLFSFANVSPAHAAVGIVVNSDADTVGSDGACTLREAIDNANSDSDTTGGDCAAGIGADSIIFDADYTITLVGSQLPAVTSEMTITGNGAGNTIIQADANPNTATYRVFQVTSTGNLTLDSVTVRHGNCSGACATSTNRGGGIFNSGTLIVTNSTLSGNMGYGYGGGIFNNGGTTTVTNGTFSDNRAIGGYGSSGGGIYNSYPGMLTVTDSTLSGNSANYSGGGIANDFGTLTVTDSTLSGNYAENHGGGIANHGTGTMLTVTNSTLSGNSSSNGSGGGIYNNGGRLTVTNSTLSGNSSNEFGGGIYTSGGTLTMTNSTLSGNSTAPSIIGGGGGIANSGGTLTVTNSTLSGNSSTTPSLIPGGGDEVYNSGSYAVAANVFGYSGQSNAEAFFGFTPGANDFNATSEGTATALASILDTALADNGGPTQTHALVAGSPAIDFAGACGLATDQRGVARPQGAACDAGAFELVTNQPPTAVAGGSYEGLPNNAIALSGASASDDDGDPLSYSWTVNSSNCAFSDATTLNPSLTCTTDGSYTVTLTVDDGTAMTNDSATVTVITAQQGTENLQSDIQSLVDDEILKTGQANGLLKPLDNAISSLDKGNVEDACNQLNDFIVKVDEKTPTPLDAATAAGLIDSAEALKSSIGCQ